MSRESSESPSGSTLFNPPGDGGEEAFEGEADVEMELNLPEDLAARLSDVARHLGLSPSILASRAIGLVCDEVGLVQNDELSSATLVQRYQTRIDLLHRLGDAPDESATADEEEASYDWDDVDSIIRRVVDAPE